MAVPPASQQSSRASTSTLSQQPLSQQPTLVGGRPSPPRDPGVAFTRAISKFRARLTGNQLVEFKSTTYEELCKELSRIERDQDARKETMNLRRIQTCLEVMEQFSKVIEVFLNASDMVAFVWGPMKLLLVVSHQEL